MARTVSAIVVNYKTAERLPALLAALRASDAVAETIVVDSASPDRERARACGAEQFLELGENRGFGAAANAGARAATAPLLAFVNPDVRFAASALGALASELEACAAVGPRLVGPDGAHQAGDCGEAPGVLRALGYALGASTLFHRRARGRVGWLTGAFLLVRRDAFLAVSGFDESFFLFGEDVDLGRRLAAGGFECRHVPEVIVEHEGRASYRGGPLEGTWAQGVRRAHARSGSGPLGRALFAAFFGAGLLVRGLVSRGERRADLLRAARFALSPMPRSGETPGGPRAAS